MFSRLSPQPGLMLSASPSTMHFEIRKPNHRKIPRRIGHFSLARPLLIPGRGNENESASIRRDQALICDQDSRQAPRSLQTASLSLSLRAM
jgi:hypothetical protein